MKRIIYYVFMAVVTFGSLASCVEEEINGKPKDGNTIPIGDDGPQ